MAPIMWTGVWLILAMVNPITSANEGIEGPRLMLGMNKTLSKASRDAFSKLTASSSKINLAAQFQDTDKSGCTELRSKRYISDGSCTSPKPIIDKICTDFCMKSPNGTSPVDFATQLFNYNNNNRQGTARSFLEKWTCVNSGTKRRKVKMLCKDGSRKVYHVRVVTHCKCTRSTGKRKLSNLEKTRKLFENRMEHKQRLN